jgi:hypothetical protein
VLLVPVWASGVCDERSVSRVRVACRALVAQVDGSAGAVCQSQRDLFVCARARGLVLTPHTRAACDNVGACLNNAAARQIETNQLLQRPFATQCTGVVCVDVCSQAARDLVFAVLNVSTTTKKFATKLGTSAAMAVSSHCMLRARLTRAPKGR